MIQDFVSLQGQVTIASLHLFPSPAAAEAVRRPRKSQRETSFLSFFSWIYPGWQLERLQLLLLLIFSKNVLWIGRLRNLLYHSQAIVHGTKSCPESKTSTQQVHRLEESGGKKWPCSHIYLVIVCQVVLSNKHQRGPQRRWNLKPLKRSQKSTISREWERPKKKRGQSSRCSCHRGCHQCADPCGPLQRPSPGHLALLGSPKMGVSLIIPVNWWYVSSILVNSNNHQVPVLGSGASSRVLPKPSQTSSANK